MANNLGTQFIIPCMSLPHIKEASYLSYHPAGISKISDFDSNGLGVARV